MTAKSESLPRIAFDAPACVDGMHERRARLPKRAYLLPRLLSRDEATLVRRLAESDPTARFARDPDTVDRLPTFDDDAICAEHEKVAAENNARIAHVGAARTAGPEGLDLFDDDREHPSLAGTYLAACVIAATIYGAEALQAPKVYRPKNLSAGAASMLRAVAVSSV